MCPPRRRVLTAAAGSLAALAGCASVLGSEKDTPTAPIYRLTVANETQAPQTVHLQLLDGEDLVYWRAVTVGAPNPDAFTTGIALAPGFPLEPGSYTLRARLDGREEWRTLEYTDVTVDDDQCFGIVVNVVSATQLGFLSSVDAAVCGSQQTPHETDTPDQ